MKNSQFSNWLRQIWLENCDEHQGYGERSLTMQEYWKEYKWWLKREYKNRGINKN
jgi:hypothetical protein